MIGMMNNASQADGPVEFYASCRHLVLPSDVPELGLQSAHRKKLSYTGDRRLVDGRPEVAESPEALWQQAMLRAACTRAVKGEAKRDEKWPNVGKGGQRAKFGIL